MSVSLEQSLREMELVHQMLHVAMAEDGHEDDETKEEYSKKVDESLASLRAKLEEARRSQGLEVGDSRKDAPAQVPKPMTVDGETGTSPDEVSKLKAGLTESHSKVCFVSTIPCVKSLSLANFIYAGENIECRTRGIRVKSLAS